MTDHKLAEQAAAESRLEDDFVRMNAALTRMEFDVANALVAKAAKRFENGGSE